MFETNQWKKRAWGLQLDCMEITETKSGKWRLWDSSLAGTGNCTVGIFNSLIMAKLCGCALLNEAMIKGSAECDKMFWGGVKYAST